VGASLRADDGGDRDRQEHQPGAQRAQAHDPLQQQRIQEEPGDQQAGGGQHHPSAGDHRPGSQQPQVHQWYRDAALHHHKAAK
jgi:hypothetical protein